MSDTPISPRDVDSHYGRNFKAIPVDCPSVRVVQVSIGEKVLVASDFFIKSEDQPGAAVGDKLSLDRFIAALNGWDGPGVVILAGNLLDLMNQTDDNRQASYDSPLFQALNSLIVRASVKIYLLPGYRDSRFAWDSDQVESLRERFPFELALQVELRVQNLGGWEKVLVTSGREFDPAARALDPYSAKEASHLRELTSAYVPRQPSSKTVGWLTGADRLRDPASEIRFLISRMTYRRVTRIAPWVLLAIVLSFLIKLPLAISLPIFDSFRHHTVDLGPRILFIGASTLIDATLILLAVLIILRFTYSRLFTEDQIAPRTFDRNVNARIGAAKQIDEGYTGVIVGHFLTPELSQVGSGFFACTGSVSKIYVEAEAALGLPPIFRPKQQATWIEIDAGARLHVRLLSRTTFARADSLLEQMLTIKLRDREALTGQLAAYPGGTEYRENQAPVMGQIRSRRIAAAAIFIVGALNLASALTPPIRARLDFIREFLPITVSTTADALVAMASIGLMFLAGGIRRGQRQAWAFALAISIGAASLNIIKGGDFEEALTLIILALYLVSKRDSFKAPSDRPSLRRGIRALVIGAAAIILFSTVIIFGYISLFKHDHHLSFTRVLIAVSERMVGLSTHPLPGGTINEFATPALTFTGICLAAIALFLAFRPVVDRSRGLATRFSIHSDRERARAIVNSYSKGTLDYFALRDDKRFFFAHGCVVAYANYGSVALVSPDPIGPETTKNQAWSDFLAFANGKGWVVGVLGADESWLDRYQATGMHSIYVGDEAIVAFREFRLDGKKNKGLRQAVGRIRKHGYTAEFYDPSSIDPRLKSELISVMGQSRKGDAERGFSMTLGRVFDPADKHLLLTVCKDSDGKVVGFCQWVPSPGINGYSLDLMRRDLGTHPNGLTDFMIVSTIEYLLQKGYEHMSLNFATMRAVLSGEMDSMTQRVEKWFLQHMSESMQIESLWRFNSKFDPVWHPRYVVYDNAEHAPAVALAIARAEALWELPIIGRFLNPADVQSKA
ncbi:MAG: phosphatidylglycerol lysyltransferase domain-containing protein [Actinomycetota bacterium]|nr:phosphatidylglycerol lysyltransferase domain-containing protein [Actinomycetota bacterium]